QVSPAPWTEMEAVILGEYNARHAEPAPSVYDIFPEFDTIPLAAGSLGQVYKAKLRDAKGELIPAIIKVQRPGIDHVIEADIAALLDLARLLTTRTNWGKWNNISGLAEEFSATIRNETDFTLEA